MVSYTYVILAPAFVRFESNHKYYTAFTEGTASYWCNLIKSVLSSCDCWFANILDMCEVAVFSEKTKQKNNKNFILFFLYFSRSGEGHGAGWLRCQVKPNLDGIFHFSPPYAMNFRLQCIPPIIPSSLQRSLILASPSSPRCLWFQELNYSATFVDVVLQVNAAELCSSWNCSSALTIGRGSHIIACTPQKTKQKKQT